MFLFTLISKTGKTRAIYGDTYLRWLMHFSDGMLYFNKKFLKLKKKKKLYYLVFNKAGKNSYSSSH